MLRALLGFWAEDESGVDCGEAVRSRAANLLGRLEDYEQQQLEAQWHLSDHGLHAATSPAQSKTQVQAVCSGGNKP